MSDLPELFDDDSTATDHTDRDDTMTDTTDTSMEQTDDYETTRDDRDGAMSGPREYDPLELFDHYRHRTNGDETIVVLSSFGRGFQALAFDVDKAGQILATEVIGDAEDRQSAESMCKFWLKQNPKGVIGGEPEGTGGFLDALGFGGGGQ